MMTARRPDSLTELHRRLTRHIDQRRAIQLSPGELDLLVLCGAYERLAIATADYLKEQAQARISQQEAE